MTSLQAVLFDKDGTIVDFHGTWGDAIGQGLRAAAADEAALERVATAMHFDLAENRVGGDSPFVAESNDVILALLEEHVDAKVCFEVALRVSVESVVPTVGLPGAFDALQSRGVRLGIATNDYEDVVHAQLRTLGWSDRFDTIVAADSGFGAKPEPGMILGALDRLGVAASACAMVGDSSHDLAAGRAAGATTVLVTNGALQAATTEALADIVIADLSQLVPELVAGGALAAG